MQPEPQLAVRAASESDKLFAAPSRSSWRFPQYRSLIQKFLDERQGIEGESRLAASEFCSVIIGPRMSDARLLCLFCCLGLCLG